jgi:hypothetical protein
MVESTQLRPENKAFVDSKLRYAQEENKTETASPGLELFVKMSRLP